MEKEKVGGGIFGTIIFVFLIWFIFFRPEKHYDWITDLRDTWFTDTSTQIVYIGDYGPYYLPVSWNGKKEIGGEERFEHYFTIHFNNGGWIKFTGYCDKSYKDWTGHIRVCEGDYYDEKTSEYQEIVIFPIDQ